MRRLTFLFAVLIVMIVAAACGGGGEEDAAALPTDAPAAAVATDEAAPAPTATPAGDPDTAGAEDDSEADAPAGGESDYLPIVGNAIGGTLGEATPALMLEMFGTITPNGCG